MEEMLDLQGELTQPDLTRFEAKIYSISERLVLHLRDCVPDPIDSFDVLPHEFRDPHYRVQTQKDDNSICPH